MYLSPRVVLQIDLCAATAAVDADCAAFINFKLVKIEIILRGLPHGERNGILSYLLVPPSPPTYLPFCGAITSVIYLANH